jgi:hypothetical protein
MEYQQPPKRKPTPKITFPGFGNTLSNVSGDDRKYFMWLFVAAVLFIIAYTIADLRKQASKVSKGETTLTNMEWKGKVTKKYMGYDHPEINMFEIIDSQQNVKTIDISQDKSGFYNYISPYDSVYKSKGERLVRVKNIRLDTTFTLIFK